MMTRRRLLNFAAGVSLFVFALVLRFAQHHVGLLYPDGYQYLLMARGIGEHLSPTTVLGLGGDHFVPNADAAAKPTFPMAVAAVHATSVPWLDAARVVTATAGAAAVLGTALLAARITGGSALAGGAAGLLVLSSPGLSFWSGFSGPDSLAQALALGAALAFAHGRPWLGGVLTGLAVATRPELVVIAVAAGIVAMHDRDARKTVTRGTAAAAVMLVFLFASLRVPIATPDLRLVGLGFLLVGVVTVLTTVPSNRVRAAVLAGSALAVAGIGGLAAPGAVQLWHDDWPLVCLAAGSLVLLALSSRQRPIALRIGGIAGLLSAVYLLKNPGLERYFVLEIPLAALVVALGVVTISQRSARTLAVGAIALVVLGGFLRPVPGNYDQDMFAAVAKRLATTLPPTSSLVTAAPDAYGFWLPSHSVRAMRTGARGVILLDAAQRSYAPRLTGRGPVVARFDGDLAFSRPDGEIDPGSAMLVDGIVVSAR
jgi:hypothetical protein